MIMKCKQWIYVLGARCFFPLGQLPGESLVLPKL